MAAAGEYNPGMPSWVVSEAVLPQPVIRRASVHDLARVVDLIRGGAAPGTESEDDPGPPLPQAYLDAFAVIDADPNTDLLVAEYDGHVVGTFQFTCIPGIGHRGGRVAQAESVHVDAALRGRGIGEAMMRWAMDEARRRGCFRLQLTSNKSRADAHRFYRRLGFSATHEGFKILL